MNLAIEVVHELMNLDISLALLNRRLFQWVPNKDRIRSTLESSNLVFQPPACFGSASDISEVSLWLCAL
jgi:hypothetical protein